MATTPTAVQLTGDEVGVSVPATSANLGAGYDSVGVALDIPLVAVVVDRQENRILAEGEGTADLPPGDDNLVWQAFCAWCAEVGHPPPDVSIVVRSLIPLQRGMGSSSAAVVAGLLLAGAVTGRSAGRDRILAMASKIEGHPDNAAAALLGGLVVCTDDGEVTRVTPSHALRPVLTVPEQRQSTTEARAALPAEVPLAAAAANAASAASTVLGLAGDGPLRATSMVDRVHEPARLTRMPASQAVVAALRAEGIPTVLSGAGPAVLSILPSGDQDAVSRVRSIVTAAVPEGGVRVEPTAWDLAGAQLCPVG